MLRIGVDLIEIERIRKVLERHGDRFLQRVYTPLEIERYGRRIDSLAARWAAKEAVAKALGRGIGDIAWRDIEVLGDDDGAPELHLYRTAASRAAELNLSEWAISLSHTDEHAIAFVIAQ